MATIAPLLSATLAVANALSVAAVSAVASTGVPHPSSEVLTRRDFDDAAITRLGDVLDLLRSWDVASIDGFAWSASPRGAMPPTEAAFTVLVDGVEMRAGVFDRAELNRLPIDVSEVDSVIAHAGSFVEGGRVFPHGGVRIVTKRRVGPDVRGRFANGSETNDPGPWRFTEYRTPNVDRIGSAAVVSSSWPVAGGMLSGRFVDQSHIASDPALARRLRSISGDRSPEIYTRGGAASWTSRSIATPAETWSVRVTASRLRSDDFQPLDHWGREVPVRVVTTNASLDVDAPTRFGRVSALATADECDRRTRWTTRDVDLDARERRFHLSTALASNRGLGIGVHAGIVDVRATDVRETRLSFDLSAEAGTDLNGTTLGVLGAILGTDSGAPGHVVEVYAAQPVGTRHTLTAAATAMRVPARRRLDVREWNALGHRAYRSVGAETDLVSGGDTRDVGIDVQWASRLDRSTRVEVNGFVHDVRSPRVRSEEWTYVEADDAPEAGRIVFDRPPGGTIGGLAARVAWHRGGRRVQVSWGSRFGVSSVPENRWLLTASAPAGAGLNVSIRLEWREEVRWTAFEEVDRVSGGRFSADVPEASRLRLSLRKSLADGRVGVTLTLRNVFDQPVRTHPLGATEQRGVYLDVRCAWSSR